MRGVKRGGGIHFLTRLLEGVHGNDVNLAKNDNGFPAFYGAAKLCKDKHTAWNHCS